MNRIERTALVSVGINVGLVALKITLAMLSGSLALLADAWHSGSDIAASGVVWAGARISRREGSRNLALVENLAALVIGGLILWAAVGIFRRVSGVTGSIITRLPLAIGGSIVAALVSYYAAQYKLHVGRETGSPSLVADGHHSRIDTWTTGAVIVGLMGHAIGIGLDRLAAVVVALFIVESGVMIIVAAVRGLRDGSVAESAPFLALCGWAPVRAAREALTRAGAPRAASFLRGMVASRRARGSLARGLAMALIAVWAFSGVYFVGPGRSGVVLRWGRAFGDPVPPGMHFKAPWPADRVIRVDMPLVRRIELGFETREVPAAVSDVAAEYYATMWESRHAAGTYEKRPEEALRLTGDENVVDVNAVVLYRVSDESDYLFNVASTQDLVKLAAESVMGEVIGSLPIEDVLTTSRDSLETALAADLESLVGDVRAGVEIVGVRLQDMHPPLEVVSAFRDVSSAREDKNRIINEALAYENDTVPKARGDAKRLVLEAQGYRTERVDKAHGDADRFLALAGEYRKAKDITETRLYIETMEELLRNVEKFVIGSGVDLKGYDIRMFDKTLGTATELD